MTADRPADTTPGGADLSVYLVTDSGQCRARGRDVVQTVADAVAAGVDTVQLREKDAGARDLLDLVRAVCHALPHPVPVLVNDRLDVVLAALEEGLPVAGVHLGQGDLPAAAARRLLPPGALLGVSANTPEQMRAAQDAGADYVGVGPVHPTTTKANAPDAVGHDGLARAVRVSPLPVVAIGGITAEDLPRLRRSGAAGAAVVSAVCAAPDPGAAAAALARAWRRES